MHGDRSDRAAARRAELEAERRLQLEIQKLRGDVKKSTLDKDS